MIAWAQSLSPGSPSPDRSLPLDDLLFDIYGHESWIPYLVFSLVSPEKIPFQPIVNEKWDTVLLRSYSPNGPLGLLSSPFASSPGGRLANFIGMTCAWDSSLFVLYLFYSPSNGIMCTDGGVQLGFLDVPHGISISLHWYVTLNIPQYVLFCARRVSHHQVGVYGSNIGLNEKTALEVPDDQVESLRQGSIHAFIAWLSYIFMVWSFKGVLMFLYNRLTYVLSLCSLTPIPKYDIDNASQNGSLATSTDSSCWCGLCLHVLRVVVFPPVHLYAGL